MPYLTDTELSGYFQTIDEQAATIDRLIAGSESMQTDARKNTETIRAMKAAIEDIKYYVGNPSAWKYYDDGVSEKIRAILKAAGMA